MALTCTIYEHNFNLKIKNNFKSEVMKIHRPLIEADDTGS
jgi:hypothetical protein